MDDGSGYGLVLSFSDLFPTMPEEAAFVLGVEFGQLWAQIQNGQPEIDQMVHTKNRTVIERACASQGYTLTTDPTEMDEYITVRMRKTKPATNNPHGLRVVN